MKFTSTYISPSSSSYLPPRSRRMKLTSGDISGRSCLPLRHGSSSSRGNGGRACFRKIGSELPRSSYCRSDSRDYGGSTISTYSSSGTDYYSDTSTYDSEYESYLSTDESSTFLSKSYDSSTTSGSFVTDESSDFLSDTQFDSDTSTESSYSIAATKCDFYSSADGSSYAGSDREIDSSGWTDESSYSLSNSDSSWAYVKFSEGTTATKRKANISIPNKGCLADSHSSTIDSSYSYQSKSTESESSENSLSDTSTFSTDDYYSGKYHNSRHRFKPAYSSGRKWTSSTRDRSATVTVSRKYRPSTVNGQCSKRAISYCACAGGQNKKRRSG